MNFLALSKMVTTTNKEVCRVNAFHAPALSGCGLLQTSNRSMSLPARFELPSSLKEQLLKVIAKSFIPVSPAVFRAVALSASSRMCPSKWNFGLTLHVTVTERTDPGNCLRQRLSTQRRVIHTISNEPVKSVILRSDELLSKLHSTLRAAFQRTPTDEKVNAHREAAPVQKKWKVF